VSAALTATAGGTAVPVGSHRVRTRRRVLRPGWPLVALLAGFPLWWALGLAAIIYPIAAVPMAWTLWRRRPIVLPPGFAPWLLFLLWATVGVLMLGADPVGTLDDSVASRLPGWALREVLYVSATVILLYIGNLREDEFPKRRIVQLLAVMFVVTTAGGLLGMLAPNFAFTSPFEMVLPEGVAGNLWVQNLVHPAAAQLQDFLGYIEPRPKAPFDYTNTWGYALSIFAVWFCVAAFARSRGRAARSRRVAAVGLLMVAAVPVVYSLNRGLWIGIALAVALVVAHVVRRGRPMVAVGIGLCCVVAVVGLLASPARDLVAQRLDNGHSNDIRGYTSKATVDLAADSPVIGFGSTRSAQGSADSIAIGRSDSCPQCGNAVLGSNGFLFMLLISTGYVGTALFFGFGGWVMWKFRHDRTAIGVASRIVLVMTAFYAFVYDVVPSVLAFPFIAIALLWRNAQESGLAPAPGVNR
jgi:hypothetical protein